MSKNFALGTKVTALIARMLGQRFPRLVQIVYWLFVPLSAVLKAAKAVRTWSTMLPLV